VLPFKKPVRRAEEAPLAHDIVFQLTVFDRLFFRIVVIGAFSKPHEMHLLFSFLYFAGAASPTPSMFL
jgi:hypothetical protein